MGFEDGIFNRIDRNRQNRSELSPVMERAYEKSARILRDPEYAIQEADFSELYGAEAIASDTAFTERLQRRFDQDQTQQERNTKKIADTLEAIVLTQSELGNWLGENAKTLKTSRYDDFKNKVDMLAEWHSAAEGSRVLALAVDVTFGIGSVQQKLRGIRDEIDSGILGEIKYFKDERGDFMGTRRNVPRIVMGVSQQTVQQLASLWVEGENRQLGAHPVQRLFVDQMANQLRHMEQYALAKGKDVAASSYRQALSSLAPIEAEKREFALGDLVSDPVAAEIASQVESQFRIPGTR